MEVERPPTTIGLWYERAIVLDRNRREEERLKGQQGTLVPKQSEVTKLLWNALDTNIFLFLLSIFLDFIFLFF